MCDSVDFEIPNLIGKVIPNTNELKILSIIGYGSFAVVYKAEDADGVRYAVKCIVKKGLNEFQLNLQYREVELLKELSDHPNIIKLYQIIDTTDNLFLVLDLCECDLFEAIVHNHGFSNEYTKKVFTTLINTVEYLHNKHIYHRDLKPENILITYSGEIKIADFGLACMEDWSTDFDCGTLRYEPPECVDMNSNGYYPEQSDIWALGVILINLRFERNPWSYASYEDNIYNEYIHNNQDILQQQLGLSNELNDIIKKLFNENPNERCTLFEFKEAILNIDEMYDSTKYNPVNMERPIETETDDGICAADIFNSSTLSQSYYSEIEKTHLVVTDSNLTAANTEKDLEKRTQSITKVNTENVIKSPSSSLTTHSPTTAISTLSTTYSSIETKCSYNDNKMKYYSLSLFDDNDDDSFFENDIIFEDQKKKSNSNVHNSGTSKPIDIIFNKDNTKQNSNNNNNNYYIESDTSGYWDNINIKSNKVNDNNKNSSGNNYCRNCHQSSIGNRQNNMFNSDKNESNFTNINHIQCHKDSSTIFNDNDTSSSTININSSSINYSVFDFWKNNNDINDDLTSYESSNLVPVSWEDEEPTQKMNNGIVPDSWEDNEEDEVENEIETTKERKDIRNNIGLKSYIRNNSLNVPDSWENNDFEAINNFNNFNVRSHISKFDEESSETSKFNINMNEKDNASKEIDDLCKENKEIERSETVKKQNTIKSNDKTEDNTMFEIDINGKSLITRTEQNNGSQDTSSNNSNEKTLVDNSKENQETLIENKMKKLTINDKNTNVYHNKKQNQNQRYSELMKNQKYTKPKDINRLSRNNHRINKDKNKMNRKPPLIEKNHKNLIKEAPLSIIEYNNSIYNCHFFEKLNRRKYINLFNHHFLNSKLLKTIEIDDKNNSIALPQYIAFKNRIRNRNKKHNYSSDSNNNYSNDDYDDNKNNGSSNNTNNNNSDTLELTQKISQLVKKINLIINHDKKNEAGNKEKTQSINTLKIDTITKNSSISFSSKCDDIDHIHSANFSIINHHTVNNLLNNNTTKFNNNKDNIKNNNYETKNKNDDIIKNDDERAIFDTMTKTETNINNTLILRKDNYRKNTSWITINYDNNNIDNDIINSNKNNIYYEPQTILLKSNYSIECYIYILQQILTYFNVFWKTLKEKCYNSMTEINRNLIKYFCPIYLEREGQSSIINLLSSILLNCINHIENLKIYIYNKLNQTDDGTICLSFQKYNMNSDILKKENIQNLTNKFMIFVYQKIKLYLLLYMVFVQPEVKGNSFYMNVNNLNFNRENSIILNYTRKILIIFRFFFFRILFLFIQVTNYSISQHKRRNNIKEEFFLTKFIL